MRKMLLGVPVLMLHAAVMAQTQPVVSGPGAAAHVAGLLTNDARDLMRNPALPPEIAATEATILLQWAVKLDAADLRTQRLLAETARMAGKNDLQRQALRAVIKADSGDFVSQVRYIDLLGGESQTMEERGGVFRNALGTAALDAQIRSEMAVRLARLAENRGDIAQAKDYLAQALKLNDVNVGALRDLVRLTAEDRGPNAADAHLRALVALLVANPYQPDAWLQAAHECLAAGAHDRAAEFMVTAGEQMQLNGIPPAADYYLDLAMEQAISGQRATAYPLAAGLAQLPDAPLGALMLAELLSQDLPPLPAPPATGTAPAFDRGAEIRKRLAEMAKDPANAASLADAAGADLTVMAKTGPDTAAWIDAYANLVDPADTTLARLRGWQLFRQGTFDKAKAELEKIARTDLLAQVGLARVLIALGQTDAAQTILQKLWNDNPQGLLALQVSIAVGTSHGKITLVDAPAAKSFRATIGKLTPGLSGMHRQPRDAVLISTYLKKTSVAVGDPVMLQLRMTNASDRPLPVGSDGMAKTMVGIAAMTRGAGTTPLGICSLEDVQRTYRLEPRQMMETNLRIDQGKLADLLQQNPDVQYMVDVTAVTSPRLIGTDQYSAGVGGMVVAADEFLRGRLALENAADFQKLATELTATTGEKQLTRIDAAGAVYGRRADDVRGKLGAVLQDLASSPDPLVKVSLLRALPALPLDSELGKALDGLAVDNDPMVRLAWAVRQSRLLMANKETPGAKAGLEKLEASEKDPLIVEWIGAAKKALIAAAGEAQK